MKHLVVFVSALALLAPLVSATEKDLVGPPAPPFSLQDVRDLLDKHPEFRTGEDVLSHLPQAYRRAPLMMYKSKSLQEASPSQPRVILFDEGGRGYSSHDGETDRLILAFNGSPSQKNYSSFEMIQYHHQEGRFEFAKIQFAPKGNKSPVLVESPPECIRCHDSPGHPNWNPYPFWPGSYPSRDGFDQTGEIEIKNYQDFYNNHRKTGRYQFIEFESPEKLTPNDDPPSKRFSNILQDMAFVTMPIQVAKTRNYAAWRHVTAAALRKCDHLEQFVPLVLLKQFNKASYAEVLKQTEAEERDAYLARSVEVSKLTGFDYGLDEGLNFSKPDVPATAGLRWVMERDGASIAPWFYTFEKTNWTVMRSLFDVSMAYRFDQPGLYTAFECDKLKEDSLHDLNELVDKDSNAISTGLKESSLVGDRNVNAVVVSENDGTTAQEILQSSCVKCHSHPEVAPLFHLDNLALFAAQLREKPVGKASTAPTLFREWIERLKDTGDRRMPPDHQLTPAQVTALTHYVEEIVPNGRRLAHRP